MTLIYDDIPGSWGTQSQGWLETDYTIGKWLLCTQAHVVPYGSYVKVDDKLRIENKQLLDKLEEAYNGMFVRCKYLLRQEFV